MYIAFWCVFFVIVFTLIFMDFIAIACVSFLFILLLVNFFFIKKIYVGYN